MKVMTNCNIKDIYYNSPCNIPIQLKVLTDPPPPTFGYLYLLLVGLLF